MCSLYAHQDPDRYASTTRRLRLNGYSTSVRLENAFWSVLDRIARSERKTTPALLSELHGEILEHEEKLENFASLLRCSCLLFLDGAADIRAPLRKVSA